MLLRFAAFLAVTPLPFSMACRGAHSNHSHDHDEHPVSRGLEEVDQWDAEHPGQPFILGAKSFDSHKAFVDSGVRCGRQDPTPEEVAAADEALVQFRIAHPHGRKLQQKYQVPTYVHIIQRTNGVGQISDATISEQIQVINDAFDDFQFNLQETFRYTNNQWYDDNGNYKAQTREGGMETLNIWFNSADGYLGYATFPNGPLNDDGVVCQSGTVPGGDEAPYNEGDTLTHEVGHWLGLYHTFQGGCSAQGDRVDDTPSESQARYGCPTGAESCGSLDPITNFMDYTDDSCMIEFTQGQRDRMASQWEQFRGGPAVPVGTPAPVTTPAPASSPAPPPGSCKDLTVTIETDNYPDETTWTIEDGSGREIESGGPYQNAGTTFTATVCLNDGAYEFTISDSYGDGICCDYGDGEYTLTLDGQSIKTGGNFGSSDTHSFTVGSGGGGGGGGGCQDSSTWTFTNSNNKVKDCEWVAKKPDKRCNKRGTDGGVEVRSNVGCPVACSTCP